MNYTKRLRGLYDRKEAFNVNNGTQKISTKKEAYRGFSLSERLLPVILLALAAPLTVIVFGPFDIFSNNMGEFRFVLGDFFWINLGLSLLCSALLCGILLPLRGRVFDVAYAVALWLTLMLFVQGNYLNFGINSLAGDGLGESISLGQTVLNTVIWLVVGAAVVTLFLLLRGEGRDTLRLIATVVMVSVIGMQLVAFTVGALSTDVFSSDPRASKDFDVALNTDVAEAEQEDMAEGDFLESDQIADIEEPNLLTYKNLNRVSTEGNVIYFLIDRFDAEYVSMLSEEEQDALFSPLEGFTYFDDATAMYPRTYPAVTYLLTGVEADLTQSRNDNFKRAYVNAPYLKQLKENGYAVNIYSDSYHVYENSGYMHEYISNSSGISDYKVNNPFLLSLDMVRMSLYRYLPHTAKSIVGNISSPDFEKHVTYISNDAPTYTTDMKDLYDFLSENELETFSDGKNFSFIHFDGCHLPNKYNENFEPANAAEADDPVNSIRQSFKIVHRYLEQLKELGLYEDATIVITGDHDDIVSEMELKEEHVTALWVKPSGIATGEMTVSSAPVSHADLFATVFSSEGLDTSDWGESVFDIPTDSDRTRKYYYQGCYYFPATDSKDYMCSEYEIVGSAKDYTNWRLVDEYWLGRYIYD